MGGVGVFLKCTPHLHYASPAARTPSGFFFFLFNFKTIFSLKMLAGETDSGRRLFGEEAVAGRFCIGCAGFRMDGCWKRSLRGASLRGGLLCPRPAHATPRLRPPRNSILESLAKHPSHHQTSLKAEPRVLFLFLVSTSFIILFSFPIWICIFRTRNRTSKELKRSHRPGAQQLIPLALRSSVLALSLPLRKVAALGLKKKLVYANHELK